MAAFGTILKKGLLGPVGQVAAAATPGLGYNLSKVLADVGQKYNLPDFKISEQFGSYQPAAKNYATDNSQGQIAGVSTTQIPGLESTADLSGLSFGTPYKPATSGQGQGGAGGGGAARVSTPTVDTSNGNGDIRQLRDEYGLARRGIEGQGQGLDQSYNLSKGDIENAIAQSEQAATEQKGTLDNQFGNVLRNQLKTYQDTNRQRQNIFSSLGTLESSAYGDQQQRADSNFTTDRTTTENEKIKALKSVDDQLSTYKKQAGSELARLGLQYQQGKQAIAQALSQNNLEEAGAARTALDQIRQKAQSIQDFISNASNTANTLRTQAGDVKKAISGITGNDYAGAVSKALTAQQDQLNGLVPQDNTFSFTGYIAPNGRRYSSEEEYLKLKGAGMA